MLAKKHHISPWQASADTNVWSFLFQKANFILSSVSLHLVSEQTWGGNVLEEAPQSQPQTALVFIDEEDKAQERLLSADSGHREESDDI